MGGGEWQGGGQEREQNPLATAVTILKFLVIFNKRHCSFILHLAPQIISLVLVGGYRMEGKGTEGEDGKRQGGVITASWLCIMPSGRAGNQQDGPED